MSMVPSRLLALLGIFALVFSASAVLLADGTDGAPTYRVNFYAYDGTAYTTEYATQANQYHVTAPAKYVGCWTYTNHREGDASTGVIYIDPATVWRPTDTITQDTNLYAAYPPIEYRSPGAASDGPDYLLYGSIALAGILGALAAVLVVRRR